MDETFSVREHIFLGLEATDELLQLQENRVTARLALRVLAASPIAPRVRLVAVVHTSLVPTGHRFSL